ncbi:hypothetical protein HanPSC8_Chr10g0439211 [Helianthus annuus]|nr:hypothetical protein HanPSC8_Chr10g0439211 [Helianthus annuus]
MSSRRKEEEGANFIMTITKLDGEITSGWQRVKQVIKQQHSNGRR